MNCIRYGIVKKTLSFGFVMLWFQWPIYLLILTAWLLEKLR